MHRPVRFFFAAASLLTPLALFAADPPPKVLTPLSEKIDVSLINVDVTVTDRAGRPITGLTRDDFEILEDGKPQTVKGFYAIEKAVPRDQTAAETPEARRFRRKVLLLIDNNTLPKIERDSTLKAVDRFIDDHFEGDYEWSVVDVGPRAVTVQAFTTDKSKIHQALEKLRNERTYEGSLARDRSILSDSIRSKVLGDNGDNGMTSYNYGQSVRFLSREQTLRTLQATMDTARSVIHACRAYSSSEGKKIVLLVTGGMELNSSFGVWDSAADRNMQEMKKDLERVLEAMVVEANAANFNLYVMDGRAHGLNAPQYDVTNKSLGLGSATNIYQEGTAQKLSDTSDTDSSAMKIALSTGGLYLPDPRMDKSLEKLDSQTGNYYSLAYTPPHIGDGKYHHIKVVTKKRGASLHNREGYVDLSNDARFEQMLRAPISFPKTSGSLPVTINLGRPADVAAKKLVVPVVASMPVSKLTMFPQGDRSVGRVHVYLTVYDKNGNNVGFSHQVQDVSMTEKEMKEIGAITLHLNVALMTGDFTVVVTLRDDTSNEIGSATKTVSL